MLCVYNQSKAMMLTRTIKGKKPFGARPEIVLITILKCRHSTLSHREHEKYILISSRARIYLIEDPGHHNNMRYISRLH